MAHRMHTDRGASLVSVLIVLVVLGGLGALAVAALPDDPSGTSDELRSLESTLAPAAPTSAGGGVRSLSAGAGADACMIMVRTLNTAAEAKHAADGTYPADPADLVPGYLSEEPAIRGYVLRMEANGKVLVNDLPAEQGCAAPRPGP